MDAAKQTEDEGDRRGSLKTFKAIMTGNRAFEPDESGYRVSDSVLGCEVVRLRLTPPDQNEAFGDKDGDGEEGVMGNSTMGPMEEVRKGKRRSLEDALANTGTPDLE